MRVLVLCNRIPYPTNDGGAIAMYNMLKSIKSFSADLSLFALNTKKHFQSKQQIESAFQNICKVYAPFINTDIKLFDAFLNLFTDKSYNLVRFYNESINQELIELLKKEKFDVIQFETLFTCEYIHTVKKYSNAKVIYRPHNVESQIWFRLANKESGLKQKYLNLLARRIEKYELDIPKYFDCIFPITAIDEKYFNTHFPSIKTHVVPVALNIDQFQNFNVDAEPNSIFHIGSLDWLPNQEAVVWFTEIVIPALKKNSWNNQFYIAGKNTPDKIYQLANTNVKVLGEVEDAKKFMLSKEIMIVPLFSGGGMRVKIIEGLALGKVIISTNIGLEGIPCTHMHDVIIADTADEFVNAILWCENNKPALMKISENAKVLASQFNIENIGKSILPYYQS